MEAAWKLPVRPSFPSFLMLCERTATSTTAADTAATMANSCFLLYRGDVVVVIANGDGGGNHTSSNSTTCPCPRSRSGVNDKYCFIFISCWRAGKSWFLLQRRSFSGIMTAKLHSSMVDARKQEKKARYVVVTARQRATTWYRPGSMCQTERSCVESTCCCLADWRASRAFQAFFWFLSLPNLAQRLLRVHGTVHVPVDRYNCTS